MRYLILLFFLSFLACSDEREPAKMPSAGVDKALETVDSTFTPLQTTVRFQSEDGVVLTADVSEISEEAPYMLLCHQAGFSRGEYVETSAWFNTLGFNTLAIDLRSGNEVNDVPNETALHAQNAGQPSEPIHAEKDMRAGIEHIATLLTAGGGNPIYIVGSSYSASLALKIAADPEFKFRDQLAGVLAFSPGEYFDDLKITPSLSTIQCRVFASGSLAETDQVKQITSQIPADLLTHYVPTVSGIHGSRCLWQSTEGYKSVRNAVVGFLK